MKKLIIKWIVFALVIMATCYLPGIKVENFAFAMLIAACLTLINVFIKPIIKLLALPINLFTFGLFNLVINFGILYGISYLIPQYALDNPLSAFYASLIIAISYSILKKI
ncbi:phage holin family protein [bacterium]|nr:phage holin family protein [bacterium]